MEVKKGLDFTNSLLKANGQKNLTAIESTIFREVWENQGKTYKQIASGVSYTDGTINTTACIMWKRLTEVFEVAVTKNRLQEVVEATERNQARGFEQQAELILSKKTSIQRDASFPSSSLTSKNKKDFRELTNSERQTKYRQALELIKGAGSVESWHELNLILAAFDIYKQFDDVELAANLLLTPITTSWEKREHVGVVAYRLGMLTPMNSAINWVIEKIESGCYLPDTAIARFYNQGGDLVWMSSNNTGQALLFHQKAQEWAYKSRDEHILIASESNKALCNLDREEIEEAKRNISKGYELIYSPGKNYDCRRHEIVLNCLSAYVETLRDRSEATELIEEAYYTLSSEKEFEKLLMWEKNNLPIFIARSLQNIGDYGRSFEMYMKADGLAKASGCIQVEAQAIAGKALLSYLQDKKFYIEKAISGFQRAKKKFESIKAEGDIAQVDLLLGVLFKELGRDQESRKYFNKVEEFYIARDAPRKVTRVNQVRQGDSQI